MRRALTVVLLLALMAGFGFGVNRLIASRKSKIPTEATVFVPSATRPKIVLPGTLYLAQNGDIYRLSDGFFTDCGRAHSVFFTDPDGLEGEVLLWISNDADVHPPGTPAEGYEPV